MNSKKSTDIFNDGSKPVDYKALFFEYLLHWPVILVCLVLAIAGAYVYLRYQPPVYSVGSTVLIKQGDKTKASSIGQLAAMQDMGTISLANNFDNEVEILQSYSLVRKVVERLGLYIDYFEPQRYGYDIPLYKNTSIQVWMAPGEAEKLPSALQVQIDSRPGGAYHATVCYRVKNEEYTLEKSYARLPAVFITPVGTLSLRGRGRPL